MKTSRVSVRQTKDIELVTWLNNKIFPGEPLHIYPTDICWVLTIDGYAAGFCTLRPLIDTKGKSFCGYMNRAGILKWGRGKRYHKKLIDVRIKYCKRNYVDKIITYTIPENFASANSLIDRGFRLYEPEYKYADDDSLYFYYDIKQP